VQQIRQAEIPFWDLFLDLEGVPREKALPTALVVLVVEDHPEVTTNLRLTYMQAVGKAAQFTAVQINRQAYST